MPSFSDSFDDLMTNTCVIQKKAATRDAHGQPGAKTDVLTGVACRLSPTMVREGKGPSTSVAGLFDLFLRPQSPNVDGGELTEAHFVTVDGASYNVAGVIKVTGLDNTEVHHLEVQLAVAK